MRFLLISFLLITCFNLHSQELSMITSNPELQQLLDVERESKLNYEHSFVNFYHTERYKNIKALIDEETLIKLCNHKESFYKLIGESIKLDKAVKKFSEKITDKQLSQLLDSLVQKCHFISIKDGHTKTLFTSSEVNALRSLSIDTTIYLLSHPSPAIKTIAALNLINKNQIDPILPFITKDFADKNIVGYSGGCLFWSGLIGDVVMSHIYGNDRVPERYCFRLDSMLIFEDNPYFRSLEIFKKLIPYRKYRKRLLELVQEKKYVPAIIPLLRMDKQADIPIAMELLETSFFMEMYQKKSYYLIKNQRSILFVLKHLKMKREEDLIFHSLHEIHKRLMVMNDNELKELSYNNKLALYRTMLCFSNPAIDQILVEVGRKEILRVKDFRKMIGVEYNPYSCKRVFDYWEKNKTLENLGLLDSLYGADPKRTIELANMVVDSFLNIPHENLKTSVGFPDPILNIIKMDNVEKAGELFIKILNHKNLPLVYSATFILPVTDKVFPVLVEKINTENDYYLLERCFYLIYLKGNKKILHEMREVLRSKEQVTYNGKTLSNEAYITKLKKLFEHLKCGN